jgi:hypothetical protein
LFLIVSLLYHGFMWLKKDWASFVSPSYELSQHGTGKLSLSPWHPSLSPITLNPATRRYFNQPSL